MKLEINIPTKLKEIKLSQYQKFLSIAKDNDDAEFIQQKMIQIFCGIDLKDVLNIKYKDIVYITESLNKMFTDKNSLVQTFKMGGVEFGFIPNLEDISFGEYTDLDTYITDWDNMHKAMAVLYRPIKQKSFSGTYDIEEYNGTSNYSDLMKNVSLDIVLGSIVFFYNLGNELLKATIHYLENNQEVQNILQLQTSGKNGDGTVQSMLLLKETLADLIRFQDYQ